MKLLTSKSDIMSAVQISNGLDQYKSYNPSQVPDQPDCIWINMNETVKTHIGQKVWSHIS